MPFAKRTYGLFASVQSANTFSVELNMLHALFLRPAVEHGLATDYYDALCAETLSQLVADFAGNAVCIFEYVYLDKLACFKAVGKAFEHIFAYAVLSHLAYRGYVRRERF